MIEIISYKKGRCCCGKIDLAPENEDVIHNDTVHQLLGPEGNFCGPTHLHTIKQLESRVREKERLHHVPECNYQSTPLGSPGCLCRVQNKNENANLHNRIKILEDALRAYVLKDDCKYGGSYKDYSKMHCGNKLCRYHNGIAALPTDSDYAIKALEAELIRLIEDIK